MRGFRGDAALVAMVAACIAAGRSQSQPLQAGLRNERRALTSALPPIPARQNTVFFALLAPAAAPLRSTPRHASDKPSMRLTY